MARRARFSIERSGKVPVATGWIALNHRYSTSHGGAMVRGKWYKIESSSGSVYRVLRFSPLLRHAQGEFGGEVSLDWDSSLELWGGESASEPRELLVTEASLLQSVGCAWRYPDPAVQLSLRFAIVLGGLSLIISSVGLIR